MTDGGVRLIQSRSAAQLSLLEPTAGAASWAPVVQLGPDGSRLCVWCNGPIPWRARRDSITCSKRCRQARHRFGAGLRRLPVTDAPMSIAYADPPYPGKAEYYRDHKDYGGEVDHRELLARLGAEYPDGWALSTSARALPVICAVAVELQLEVRVAGWYRGARTTRSRWPLSAWEPVLYAGGRREVQDAPPLDALYKISRPRRADPARVIGGKPADFVWWLFDLLGVLPGDRFDDLYPGSGGVGRAFAMLEQAAVAPAGSRDTSTKEAAA